LLSLLSNLFTKRPHQINILGNQQYTEKEEKCMVLLHEAYVLSHLEKGGKMKVILHDL
jgi:hypothetical protein